MIVTPQEKRYKILFDPLSGNYLMVFDNSKSMTIKVITAKATQLQHDCIQVLSRDKLSIREVARIIGKIVSSFPGVKYEPLYYRHLEKHKITALKHSKGCFDSNMTLSIKAREELQWWVDNAMTAFKPIPHGQPDHTITIDASKLGWGAECDGASSWGN